MRVFIYFGKGRGRAEGERGKWEGQKAQAEKVCGAGESRTQEEAGFARELWMRRSPSAHGPALSGRLLRVRADTHFPLLILRGLRSPGGLDRG